MQRHSLTYNSGHSGHGFSRGLRMLSVWAGLCTHISVVLGCPCMIQSKFVTCLYMLPANHEMQLSGTSYSRQLTLIGNDAPVVSLSAEPAVLTGNER